MRMLALAIIAAAGAAPHAAQAQSQAPFCLVSNTGHPSCFYYSLDACRSAQGSLGGMCTANIQAQQQTISQPMPAPQALQHPDIAGSYMRGAQAGQEMRIREQEHRARMATLEAQRSHYAAPPQPFQQTMPAIRAGQSIVYRCQLRSGGVYYTSQDIVGCTEVHATNEN